MHSFPSKMSGREWQFILLYVDFFFMQTDNSVPIFREIVAPLYPCSSVPKIRSVFIMIVYGDRNDG